MEDIINTKLIREVLNPKHPIEDISIYNDNIIIECKYGLVIDINIYELSHKCKEWAEINHGYILCSYKCGSVGNCQIMKLDKFFIASTEPEAIFKACQYILDNKDQKG